MIVSCASFQRRLVEGNEHGTVLKTGEGKVRVYSLPYQNIRETLTSYFDLFAASGLMPRLL